VLCLKQSNAKGNIMHTSKINLAKLATMVVTAGFLTGLISCKDVPVDNQQGYSETGQSGVRQSSDSGENNGNSSGKDEKPNTSSSSSDGGYTPGMLRANGTPWEFELEQPEKMRITNRCNIPIWIEFGDNRQGVLERLNPGKQNSRIDPGKAVDYKIPETQAEGRAGHAPGVALEGTRFAVKQGCDANGRNCDIGEAYPFIDAQGREQCPQGGCHAPVQSKFEATWADTTQNTHPTWYNASHVDGYSLPYVIIPKGPRVQNRANDCMIINGSMLDAAGACPRVENLDPGGNANFNNIDLAFIGRNSGEVVGCHSPCKLLAHGAQYPEYRGKWVFNEWDDPVILRYCCPTQTAGDGKTVTRGISPEDCNDRNHKNSIWKTNYLQHLKEKAPTIYTFAYDDAESLFTCPKETKFEMIFCPEQDPRQPSKLQAFYNRHHKTFPETFNNMEFFEW
jgi:hypothetical protein